MSDTPPPPPAQPAYGGAVPPTPPVGVDYASWLIRVGAYFLDQIVGTAIAIPLLAPGFVLLFSSLAGSVDYDPTTGVASGGEPNPLAIVLLVVGSLGVIAFSIWNYIIRQGRTGQTLGKKWVGIKVVREATGAVPGIGLALGRVLLQSILTSLTLYLNVLWPLWDARNQTLHDKVCSTVVIRVP